MGGGGVQGVGVIGLRGGAEAGGEGGSGQLLLALGGQRGVPGQGAPYRARQGGAGGAGGRRGEVIKLMVRGGVSHYVVLMETWMQEGGGGSMGCSGSRRISL